MLTQTKVLFPGNGITFVNEVPSVNPRFTEDISDLYPHGNLLSAFIVCNKPFSLQSPLHLPPPHHTTYNLGEKIIEYLLLIKSKITSRF